MKTNKILIIGKSGNLGGYFLNAYSDEHPKALGREELDITKEEDVLARISEIKPDIVINCVAYNAVDKAEKDTQAMAVNGYGPGYIADACKQTGATLVHFSTGMVFDGNNPEGYKEDDLTAPVNAYGRSKLMGEMEIQTKTENFYIIRTCWLFGKKGSGASNKPSFTDIMLDMARQGKTIEAVDDEFGKPTYMKDLAEATKALVEEKRPYGIYHLVNSGVCSRFDWANEIFSIAGIDADLSSVSGSKFTREAKRPKYEVLNNTKFIELRPWTEALREYLKENQ